MIDIDKIKAVEIDKTSVRNTLKVEFLKVFSGQINHQPYKQILNDMSSGCAGCRRSAFFKALKLLKQNKSK
jgi:formate dehydrogenase assembly factor FdhD